TDTLGTGLTFGTVTAAGDFTPDTSGAPVLTFTLPAGTVPGTYTVSYTATVNDQAAGQVSNAVVGDQGTCAVDCDIDVPVADPTVTYNKAADTAGPVSVGDAITYTLAATVRAWRLTTVLVLIDTRGTGPTFGSFPAPRDALPVSSGAPVLTFTLPAGTVPGTYT